MISSSYRVFCLRLFGKLLSRFNKKPLDEKNLPLVKANIPRSYEEYYSTAMMNTLLGVIISIFFSYLLSIFLVDGLKIFVLIIIPFLTFVIIITSYLYYPSYRLKSRGRNIDLFLPYAINFISSMAVAGISPSEIFETLAKVSVYGEVQVEAKKITKEIKVMGMDNITALKHAIEISPSKKFKNFLQGIIGTIQSGSSLHDYLTNVASKYMEDDLSDRKRDLDLLAVIAEVLVLAVIAFPILLVIILTVMGFFGGSMDVSLIILLLFSFLILPVIYIMFYILIKSTSIEEIRKFTPSIKPSFKQKVNENKTSIIIFSLSVAIVLIFFALILVFSYLGYYTLDLYIYWDFAFISTLILISPIGFYSFYKMKVKIEMQERFPDFLNEVGDSLATGMNIFESLKAAAKGHYGKLTPEIKKMKNQLSWHVSMKNVLFDFAERMKSAIAYRIIIAIDKALLMGGNTPKIFKAAAKEVDQVNQIEYQRKSVMQIYGLVILVCFFVFLAIIVILNTTIYASFLDIQSKQVANTAGVINLSSVNPMLLEYTLYTFVFVQSIGAGILAGFMADGKVSSGIRYSCLLTIITIIAFKTII